MNSTTLRTTIFARATRRGAWAFLTKKDKLTKWFKKVCLQVPKPLT